MTSSFFSSIAWLGTVEMHDPCVRTANEVSCGTGYTLEPGTLVVEIQAASFPTSTSSTSRPARGR
jgi:hypothetical protein